MEVLLESGWFAEKASAFKQLMTTSSYVICEVKRLYSHRAGKLRSYDTQRLLVGTHSTMVRWGTS